MAKKRKKKKGKNERGKERVTDPFYLYSAAVQSVDVDLDFFRKVYRKTHDGRPFRLLREDFCGTALLAREFARRKTEHRAWGVDLDRPTLDWGDAHYDDVMGDTRSRLELVCDDVRKVTRPKVEVVAALNFSYSVFKTRAELGGYFREVRRSLLPGGMFIIDAWGGSDSYYEDQEKRPIPSEKTFDGKRVPAFTYVWDQARFNPVDHHISCHIHFKLPGGKRLKRAFTYDWRLWTLAELQELMLEGGFRATEVHAEGWDDKADEPDGKFRRKRYFENEGAWVVYVVGLT